MGTLSVLRCGYPDFTKVRMMVVTGILMMGPSLLGGSMVVATALSTTRIEEWV